MEIRLPRKLALDSSLAGERRAGNRQDEGGIWIGNRRWIEFRTVMPYISVVKIRSVSSKALRRLVESNDVKGIRPDLLNRVRNILAALISADDMDGVNGPPGWRIHQLSGDRAGTWSISASGNWRITFDMEQGEIANLDLEDYH